MNREARRSLGVSKETSDSLNKFDSYCTIKEVLQLSRASAEDVVEGAIAAYQRRSSPLQVAISLQVEIIRDILIKSGLVSEEEFKSIYMEKAEEFNKMQQEYKTLQEDDTPKMGVSASDIDVKVEE